MKTANVLVSVPVPVLLLVLVACGGESPAPATPPAPSATPSAAPAAGADWKLLYDTSAPPAPRPVPPGDADAQRIAASLSCTRAVSAVPGAFTKKGASEVAYLFECNVPEGHLLALVGDHQVVAKLAVPEDTLVEVGDLDMDGDNELLVVGHQGAKTTARLLDADGAELAPVYDFSAMGEPCARATITYRLKGGGLEFHVDTQSQPCPKVSLEEHAKRLHAEAIVVDGHNDITSAILDDGFDLGRPTGRTHTDLPRMREGGITGEFFAVYVDRRFYESPTRLGGGAARRALDMIDIAYQQIERHSDALVLATTADGIRRAKRDGKIAVLLGIEGGHAIENSLYALRDFQRLGVRYMTLTHTNNNDWADSAGFDVSPKPAHHGLTGFGEEVVREMQRIGMLVDVSHVSDETFDDVMRVAQAPIIASHSSARALCNVPRNLTDDELRAVAKNGGIVMVNFYSGYLDPKYESARAEFGKKHKAEIDAVMKQHLRLSEMRVAFAKLGIDHIPAAPLSVLVDHIDHIAKVAGVDHVGLGSDFDGVGSIPDGMGGVDGLPQITLELLRRGWSDADVKKVLGENFLRVMEAAEAYARSTKTTLSGDGSTKRIE
jgi:membrane dipeptidase